ncbi:MAG: serine/threonine-protein phosphatase [Acidobacteria bacterium]|nr:serine/threonine-protein phosphatase [Acidobacteriota bacterium]
MELWAGNERAHRHVQLAGLEGDVIALPSGGREGGDLYALFSCGADRAARMVLADCIGHGFTASRVAGHIHQLLHKFRDIRDTAGLLAALNDEFTLTGQTPGAPLRLTTVVTATFDRSSGELNYAYAAHPRMLLWREREAGWQPLGEGLEGLPLGFIAGEIYSQQSVRLEHGDMVLAFSDAVTEVARPDDEQLTAEGFLDLAAATLARLSRPVALHDFAEALVEAIGRYHGAEDFDDDLTLLTLRRSA